MTTHQNRLLALHEVIEITGHEKTRVAAVALKRKGIRPVSYRPQPGKKGSPLAEYRESDVRRAFADRIAAQA